MPLRDNAAPQYNRTQLLRLTSAEDAALRRMADETGKTMAQIMRNGLRDHLSASGFPVPEK